MEKGFQKGHSFFKHNKDCKCFKCTGIGPKYWLGKKRDDPEYIEKIRKAHLGQKAWNKGNKTVFPKCKICGKDLGDNRSKLCKKCCKGENHYLWNNGISFIPYTIDWTETLRKSIRERDKYICQRCGKQQGDIAHDVHHKDYDKQNQNPDNLITLCHSCHTKTTNNRTYWLNYFNISLLTNKNMNNNNGFLSIIAALVILTIGSIFLYEYKQDIDQQAEETFGGSYVQIRYGGTGTTTEPIDSNILIANSTGTYAPGQLTAGSNIIISTSTGAITISTEAGNWATTTGPSLYYENDIMMGTSSTSTSSFYFASSSESIYLRGTTTISGDTILSGTTTISGTTTFGIIPILPGSDPTNDNQAVRKFYSDFPTYYAASSTGSIIIESKATEETTANNYYTLMKELAFDINGTATFQFSFQDSTGASTFVQLARNRGGATSTIGSEQSVGNTTVIVNQDIGGWQPNDTVQLWMKTTSGGTARIRAFKVMANQASTTVINE